MTRPTLLTWYYVAIPPLHILLPGYRSQLYFLFRGLSLQLYVIAPHYLQQLLSQNCEQFIGSWEISICWERRNSTWTLFAASCFAKNCLFNPMHNRSKVDPDLIFCHLPFATLVACRVRTIWATQQRKQSYDFTLRPLHLSGKCWFEIHLQSDSKENPKHFIPTSSTSSRRIVHMFSLCSCWRYMGEDFGSS